MERIGDRVWVGKGGRPESQHSQQTSTHYSMGCGARCYLGEFLKTMNDML
jgi:hypothetical protein